MIVIKLPNSDEKSLEWKMALDAIIKEAMPQLAVRDGSEETRIIIRIPMPGVCGNLSELNHSEVQINSNHTYIRYWKILIVIHRGSSKKIGNEIFYNY
ncbi:hypothetical protein TNCT_479001 [Trichonephila clavata]|uniref:Uncharacterized protein n=1 Tax=Trichonephila clavata TaxID=2740835 RepID=A0A8X6FGY5_TRICU|nr:hypothetical protein TNCT_479001 [Trichonephila clavata]